MELNISENLRKLRKERGNTQDDLANHLGISVQAVSKWERGDGFPDITLLPYIASYYDVTVDDILGCNSLRKQEDIESFKKQAQILINKGKRKERLELCREMQKKYPNDEYVLYNLMYDLWAVEHAKNSEEIIRIATKLLKSDSLEFRYGAIQILAFTYHKTENYVFESAVLQRDCEIANDQINAVIDDLLTLKLIRKQKLTINGESRVLYYSRPSHNLLAVLLMTREIGYKGAYSFQSHIRNTPFIKE